MDICAVFNLPESVKCIGIRRNVLVQKLKCTVAPEEPDKCTLLRWFDVYYCLHLFVFIKLNLKYLVLFSYTQPLEIMVYIATFP